ncbi:hypothetical protein BDK92_3576 [Micromonospora pisi]|uniref:Uncharacterized protein n=1 Tax=Micromonospora pisi TaxID=589240 RepID=A0A495JJP0_9ACTN|nr:hypothetical protein [Micromonospora pisi]RKR89236.1 hypothetical protein BDK92_3576 [Micromonospora pisi]
MLHEIRTPRWKRLAGRGRAATVTVSMAAGLVAVVAQPAYAIGYHFEENSSWAYTDAHRPTKIYIDGEGDLPVGSWVDDRDRVHTARAYYTFDITRYRGAVINSAIVSARETSVTDCTQRPPVELWRTAPVVADKSNWKSPPAELAKLYTSVQTEGGCPRPRVEWNAAEGVRQALAEGASTLTLALRLPAGLETDPAQGRRFTSSLGLSVGYNHPPSVPTDLTTGSDKPCATTAPGPLLGRGNVGLAATISDPDNVSGGSADNLTALFAVWPVDNPAARVERTTGLTGVGRVGVGIPLEYLEHGGSYAWAVRTSDPQDASAWSATCYFNMDMTGPDQPPTVSSTDYPDDGNFHSGTGIPGEFSFGPNGVTDIEGYYYSTVGGALGDWVAAGPGGTATVTITPQESGGASLYVTSVDRAGNRSSATAYRYLVRDNGPIVEGEITAVGVSGTLTFRPRLEGVVQYRYQFNGEPEQIIAARADGSAEVSVTLLAGGFRELTVTSRTAAGLEATTTRTFYLRTEPSVTSVEYPRYESSGGTGVPGRFTFTPGLPGVVSYLYSFAPGGPEQSVAADATGTAVLSWTPTVAGLHHLRVRSVSADGTQSPVYDYLFTVINHLPEVVGGLYDDTYVDPYGGPGVTGWFYVSSAVADVTEFVYQFNDGPQQTIPAEFGTARILFTPTFGGRQVLEVGSRTTSGVESAVVSFPFQVYSAPLVNSADYPENAYGGLPGVPGTFTLTGQLPGTVEYRYRYDFFGEEQTVAATDGNASIVWTPPHSGWFYFEVYGVTADGTRSDTRSYSFGVRELNPDPVD